MHNYIYVRRDGGTASIWRDVLASTPLSEYLCLACIHAALRNSPQCMCVTSRVWTADCSSDGFLGNPTCNPSRKCEAQMWCCALYTSLHVGKVFVRQHFIFIYPVHGAGAIAIWIVRTVFVFCKTLCGLIFFCSFFFPICILFVCRYGLSLNDVDAATFKCCMRA